MIQHAKRLDGTAIDNIKALKIAVAHNDGIGPEIIKTTLKIFKASWGTYRARNY